MIANGSPICSEMNIKVELSSVRNRLGKLMVASGWDMSLPGETGNQGRSLFLRRLSYLANKIPYIRPYIRIFTRTVPTKDSELPYTVRVKEKIIILRP